MAREKASLSIRLRIVVFYPLTHLLGRRRFEGIEHIPETGSVLVAGNHISYLDPVYSGVFIHRRGRIPRFLAKQDLWRLPVVGAPIDLSDFRPRPVDAALLREATDRVMGQIRDLLAEVRQEPPPAGFFDPGEPGKQGS